MLENGITCALIQTDNLEVTKALIANSIDDFGIIVLRQVQRLMISEGQWQI